MPDSPFPGRPPRPDRDRHDHPERSERPLSHTEMVASTWRTVHRIEVMIHEFLNATLAGQDSIPPMRPPMQTFPGVGSPADSSARFDAPKEAIEKVLQDRELKRLQQEEQARILEEKERKKYILGIVGKIIVGVAVAVIVWEVTKTTVGLGH